MYCDRFLETSWQGQEQGLIEFERSRRSRKQEDHQLGASLPLWEEPRYLSQWQVPQQQLLPQSFSILSNSPTCPPPQFDQQILTPMHRQPLRFWRWGGCQWEQWRSCWWRSSGKGHLHLQSDQASQETGNIICSFRIRKHIYIYDTLWWFCFSKSSHLCVDKTFVAWDS